MGDVEVVAGLPIVASGVDVVFQGGTRALVAADVTIPPRQHTFVLGPNGSGKSTLLRVLHGLVVPTRGRVKWGGADTPPASQAMVFQRPVLLRRSAIGNLLHALALAGVRGEAAHRLARDALATVGLAALAERPARALSGGEQQRLALARAWALVPDVLFLDEPTASLDPYASRAVETIIGDFRARGTTVVMSTHHLAQAKRMADSVVFLNAGRVIEHTDGAQFFASPTSAEAREFLDGERL